MHRLAGLLSTVLILAGCGDRGAEPNQATANVQNEAAAQPAGISLDNALVFADPLQCRAAPALRQALDRMLVHDEGSGSWFAGGAVTLAGIAGPLTPQLASRRSTVDGLQVVDYESTLVMPANTRWHGLRVSRLVVSHADVFESDDQDMTSIQFEEAPATVRRVLGEHGFDVPLAPAYRELEDGACGGAMQVVAVPGGAALQCGYGC